MKKILLFLFWIGFLSAIYFYNIDRKTIRIDFDAAIFESDYTDEMGQFYFDTGKGFNEKQVVAFKYHNLQVGQFGHYSIKLPVIGVKRLRFDPLKAKGRLTIKNLIVRKYYPFKISLAVSPEQVVPLHSIDFVRTSNSDINILSNGEDPYLMVFQGIPYRSRSFINGFLQEIAWDKLFAGILGLVLLSGLLTYYVEI